jgi:hypothetical protein
MNGPTPEEWRHHLEVRLGAIQGSSATHERVEAAHIREILKGLAPVRPPYDPIVDPILVRLLELKDMIERLHENQTMTAAEVTAILHNQKLAREEVNRLAQLLEPQPMKAEVTPDGNVAIGR